MLMTPGTRGGRKSQNKNYSDLIIGSLPGGTLTLTPGVGDTVTDVVGATSIYYTPTFGGGIPLPYGSGWKRVPFGETALGLNATFHTANTNYDVWGFFDNGGLSIASKNWFDTTNPANPSDPTSTVYTSRQVATAGVIVNANGMTVRNGSTTTTLAPGSARLLGSFRTTSAGQTEDSFTKRFLSRLDYPAVRPFRKSGPASDWTYATATIRQINADSTMKVGWLHCVGTRFIDLQTFICAAINSTTTTRTYRSGIGIDSTTAFSNSARGGPANCSSNSWIPSISNYRDSPGIGFHEANWLEIAAGADTQTLAAFTSALTGWTMN